MNKNKFLFLSFMLGMLIMGIGIGVGFFEFQTMTYCGEKPISTYNWVTKEFKGILPEDANIFYNYSGSDNIKFEADSSIEDNTYNATVKVPMGESLYLGFDEGKYVCNGNNGHISNTKYSWLNISIYSGGINDLEVFKTFIYDIKERKLYNYNTPDVEVTVKVAPENLNRFKLMPDGYFFLEESLPFDAIEGEDIYFDSSNGEFYTIEENKRKALYNPYETNEETYEDAFKTE